MAEWTLVIGGCKRTVIFCKNLDKSRGWRPRRRNPYSHTPLLLKQKWLGMAWKNPFVFWARFAPLSMLIHTHYPFLKVTHYLCDCRPLPCLGNPGSAPVDYTFQHSYLIQQFGLVLSDELFPAMNSAEKRNRLTSHGHVGQSCLFGWKYHV